MRIADINPPEKPREKALLRGLRSLSDAELLALIIQSGCHGSSALEIAFGLIDSFGGLSKLAQAEIGQIKAKGIRKAKELKLLAVFELGKRAWNNDRFLEKIESASECALKFGAEMGYLKEERLKMVCLDYSKRFLKEETFTAFDGEKVELEIKRLIRSALQVSSYYVYLIHNHPSGNPSPSSEDVISTKTLILSLNSVGIRLLDHIIVSGGEYYSLRDKTGGRIKKKEEKPLGLCC